MREFKYMTLSEIAPYEKEMQILGVSKISRSPRGFLTYYKKIGGNPQRVNDFWRAKRHSFISRTLGAYRLHKELGHNVERQKLSLVAWAYYPNI